jgi:hypothetical protein
MNKPAPKEPSMDEILSSIRQIIADDDAASAPKKAAAPVAGFAPVPPRPLPGSAAPAMAQPAAMPEPEFEPELDSEPFALSSEQILRETAVADSARSGTSFEGLLEGLGGPDRGPALIDPDDIAFEADLEEEEELVPEPEPELEPEPEPEPEPVFVAPPPPPVARPRPAASVAQAAPLPDPTLTADLAAELLEPTTQSAVQSTFARLSGLSTVSSAVTIEDMMREMLRPMLKEWLDENLPAVVERMVEKEIARVSRGGR